MFCPPPPQSNIESVEKYVFTYKREIESKDLGLYYALNEAILTESNTLDSINVQEAIDIEEFIGTHRLAPFMKEVEVQVKKYFPHSIIVEELYTDPEEGGTKLYLTILAPNMSKKEVLKNNLRLFRDWELVQNRAFNAYVNITARAV